MVEKVTDHGLLVESFTASGSDDCFTLIYPDKSIVTEKISKRILDDNGDLHLNGYKLYFYPKGGE
jgi:hypothetical protein